MPKPRESFIEGEKGRLYVRDIGSGQPIIVVHGGPSLDHEYLVPDMDRLAESFRLVYYAQRGRGKSYTGNDPDDISISSEVEDLDLVNRHTESGPVALLGHSWGGLLALEYAVRRPDHVSHLILMNTAPVSHSGRVAHREHYAAKLSSEQKSRLEALRTDPAFQEGDVGLDVEAHRISWSTTIRRPEDLERVMRRLRANFTPEGIVAARVIGARLIEETQDSEGYDLTPRLEALPIPTLVLHGDNDIVPIEVAGDIAAAMPNSRLEVLEDCGHFAYIDQPERVRASISELLSRSGT